MMICLQKIYGGTKHGIVDMGGDVDVGGQPNKQQQRGKIEWKNCSNESSSMKHCQRRNGHKGLLLSSKLLSHITSL